MTQAVPKPFSLNASFNALDDGAKYEIIIGCICLLVCILLFIAVLAVKLIRKKGKTETSGTKKRQVHWPDVDETYPSEVGQKAVRLDPYADTFPGDLRYGGLSYNDYNPYDNELDSV